MSNWIDHFLPDIEDARHAIKDCSRIVALIPDCDRCYASRADFNARLITSAPKMLELLKDAADKLQDLTAEIDGDMNDSLAMKIYDFIKKLEEK